MISSLRQCFEYILDTIAQHVQRWVKLENPSLFADDVFDLTRSKSGLMLENAFLRQQLIVLFAACIPSFSSSPRMRLAPQVRFSLAMR